MVAAGVALLALVSLALPLSFVKAADILGGGEWVTDSATPFYDYGGDTGGTWVTDSATPFYDYGYNSGYSYGGSSGFSMPSFGGSSGSSFRMPTFSSANAQARSQIAPTLPAFAQSSMCNAVNSCNQDNSYVDNSVFSAPTTVTIAQDSHNQQISYAQPERRSNDRDDYEYPTYRQPQYQYQAQYQYQQPVAYSQTPYISLSQAPYTGLDLGPMGEVLYWTFLVLWCLGAAYLIVVKRVQNKVVSYLNGFLFGSTALTASGTTAGTTYAHTPAKAHVAAAKVEPVEMGIDSFIQSQINKRA